MKTYLFAAFLMITTAVQAAESEAIALHLECSSQPDCNEMTRPEGNKLRIQPNAALLLTPQNVETVEVTQDPQGTERVTLYLNSNAAAEFEKLTGENVQKILAVIVSGRVLMAPRILQKISGGSLAIQGGEKNDTFLVAEVPWLARKSLEGEMAKRSKADRDMIWYGAITAFVILGSLAFAFFRKK